MVLRRLLPFAIAFVIACTRAPKPDSVELPPSMSNDASAATPTTNAPRPTASAAMRCLPLVAKECGCVYDCGVGVESSPGKWTITQRTWGATPLTGKPDTWCYRGDCTEAFAVELPCDIICGGKPADHGCHFEGDTCTGSGG